MTSDQKSAPGISTLDASLINPSAFGELLTALQKLSFTRDLEELTQIVSSYARSLVGADGAAFVLQEDGRCYYVDEDAIGPLWKGRKFPMSACISGWAMMNRQTVIIEDVMTHPQI